jgi:preprotein translocase subunit SecG
VFYLLLTLLILDALVLIPVVLLQSGKGGGLAAMGAGGGSDTLFGSRQATTLLTKATWWTAGIFLALSFALAILSSRPQRVDSKLRETFQGGAAAPARQQAPAAVPTGLTQPAAPAAATPAAPAGTAPANTPAPAKQ